MAKDLFELGEHTMTFGEHLEELRTHLWRAIWGVAAAFIIMAYFAGTVVRILTEPVEREQRQWFNEQLPKRVQKFRDNPSHEHRTVPLRVTLDGEQLKELAKDLGIEGTKTSVEPKSLNFEVSVSDLISAIILPLAEVNRLGSLRSLAMQESMVIYFKAVLGAALVLSSPWVFYQIYSFVAVGLYAHERRFVHLTLPFSIGLFFAGVAVCYFLVFPNMLKFFLAMNEGMDIEPETRLSEWVGFAVMLLLIFGVAFQMPLLMLMLERVGILSHQQLVGQRRVAILVIFVASAVITPTGDPMTLGFLAIPMCLLFELGIFLMRYFERKTPFEATDPLDELLDSI